MIFRIPKVDVGIQYPRSSFEQKPRLNRKTRRGRVFGKQHRFDRLAGKLSPKQRRQWQ